ncbi:MAG: hypothetical protein ACO3EP_10445 [Phycisphaerales bacterium]
MIIVLNLLILGLAALIAYWWASQGAFSALLHLLCVIAAGVLAFAVWEPVAIKVLGMGALANFAWGIGLLAPFALFLFVLRLATDRLVPANLNFPQSVNYLVGGGLGALAGLVTMGILLIGAGLLQSERAFMGYSGWIRSSSNQGRPADTGGGLWVPVHTLVADFFGTLSAGSFASETGTATLKNRQPNLDRVSMSLARDGAHAGRSRVALPPDSFDLAGVAYAPAATLPAAIGGTQPIYAVGLTIRQPAFDQGVQFRLSSSQVRLIGDAGANQTAPTAHPIAWTADLPGGGRGLFPVDDTSHYVTSVPGQQQVVAWLLFPGKDLAGATPRFIQVKGVRIALPQLEQVDATKLMASVMGQGGASAAPTFDPSLRTVGGNDIRITNKIDPLQISTNDLPGMRETDSYLTEGRGTFPRSAGVRVNRSLQVKGILEPEGTRVIRLNISRGKSPVNIWDSKAREEAGAGASLMLVDEQGRTFSPIGYFWERRNDSEIDIVIDPVRGIPTVGDFPSLSSSGVDDLYALYRVSLGSKIKAIRLGEIQIANVDLEVK